MVHESRPRAREHQPSDHRAVNVTRQGDRRAWRHGRHQRGGHAERRTRCEEERFLRSDQVGRQCLRIADAAGGMERVVGGRHARQVELETTITKKGGQVRIREPAALVSWRVKRVNASLCVPVERLEQRRAVLVGYPVGVSFH
jgi:hypothetical protein